jgi:hypothetical protein
MAPLATMVCRANRDSGASPDSPDLPVETDWQDLLALPENPESLTNRLATV